MYFSFLVVSEPDTFVASLLEIISNKLRNKYKKTRFNSEEAQWPPHQPKLIVSVALIHYKGKRTQQELLEIAKIHKEGFDEYFSPTYQGPFTKRQRLESLDYSRVTKNIKDIFAADPTDPTEVSTSYTKTPKRILIEGAPGIGKTVLAKEIAYSWANNKILAEIKIVFLLYLRDPQLHSVTTTKELVEYISDENLSSEQTATLSRYLANTEGQELCIVMDGFDEYPSSLQKNSFIVKIINGRVLHEAIVVITSRPTATVSLHDQVDRRIDILGLPKEERDKYISQVFNNLPNKKVELDKYLKQQPVINGLCFVPLHLAILLYLFQQGSLPETLTEMNESFIIHTIYRHLKKRHEQTPTDKVDKLAKVPKPVLDIVHKLSELAFKGLQGNKLVFTFDEIKQTCPCIDETVGDINGFGLLQAVELYPHKGAGTTKSFNFLHFTMQEFLAALHVSTLPSEQQSSLMEKTFWDSHYNFMWMMFVGIVGVKSDVFVNFISKGKVYKRKSGVRIADTIRNNKRKCLHVFQCYLEAKENTEIPEVISSMFKDGKVVFSYVKLLPHDITSLMSFMCTKQSIQWKSLELQQCKIGDIGMNVLQQFISDTTSTLEHVDLSHNDSSPWGAYCTIIRHCSVNSLTLCGGDGIAKYINELKEVLQTNTKLLSLKLCNINDDGAVNIAEVIQMNTTIQTLDMSSNRILDDGAIAISDGLKSNISLKQLIISKNEITSEGPKYIAEAIQVNTTLEQLDLSYNKISDNGTAAISDGLKSNSKLQRLNISHNSITNVGIKKIAEAIQVNSTLQDINISKNHISIKGLLLFMEAVKNNCTLQVVNITHNNVTRCGFTSIKQCIESLQHPIQIYASWNKILSENGKLSVMSRLYSSTFHDFKDIENDVWSFWNYDPDQIVTCLSECLKEDDTLLELNMSKNKIFSGREYKVAEAIKVNITLQKLDVSFTSGHEYFVYQCLKNNKSLKELNMSNTEITSKGAKVVAEAIKVNTTLQKLDLSFNTLSDDETSFISNGLKSNKSLQELNMSKNEITTEGAKRIAEAIQLNMTLKQLDLSINKIFDDGATAISNSLKSNSTLQELNISHNNITNKGITKITEVVQINSKLQNINISKNHISTEGLLYFMEAVKNNCTLQVVNITHNNVTRSGFTRIKQCIENLQHPIQIIASWNEIKYKYSELVTKISTSCAPDNIEEDVWSFKEYDCDHLVMCLSECLKEEDTLQELNLWFEGITSEGARLIAEAIKVNKTLKKLNIRGNSISDDGATAISDGLKSNNSLQELNMSSNHITSEGAKKIAEAIKVNTTLKILNINGNTISDDGVAAISDGLKSNNSLQELDMSLNKITSEGAKKIAEAIKVNTTLKILKINKRLDHDALSFNMTVLTAVYHNNTLMKLSLPHACTYAYYHNDERLVSSEVEKINKERTRQGISTLTCHC